MRIYYQPVGAPACEIRGRGAINVTMRPPNLAYELLEARALAQVGHVVEIGTPGGALIRPDAILAATELVAPAAQRLAVSGDIPFLCRWMGRLNLELNDPVYQTCIAAARQADAHYASCAYIADQVGSVLGVPVAIVPHPILVPEADVVKWSKRDLDVLFVGWLSGTKQVDLLIASCEKAGRSLGIVGTGPALPELIAQAEVSTTPVTFFGPLFDQDLSAVYLRACRYVSASISDSWAIPIGEALAHGCGVGHRFNEAIIEAWRGAVVWWTTEGALVDWLKTPPTQDYLRCRQFVLDHGYDSASVGFKLDALIRLVI